MSANNKAVESLRSERDRFVAFSFASADILIELDEDANILFMDGAVSGLLGKKSVEFTGESFLNLVHSNDATLAHKMLCEDLKQDRIDQERIHLQSKFGDAIPFALSGYKLSALKNHYYLTLTFLKAELSPAELDKRDHKTGLYKKDSFANAAVKHIQDAKGSNKEVHITLLDLPELTELLDHLTTDAAQNLLHDISNYLRSHSLNGDSAGLVEEGAYSVILDANTDPKQIMNQLFEITRNADPSGKGVRGHSETIEAGDSTLSALDCANALLYTITRFAESEGKEFNIHSLSDGYQSMLQETVQKISEFKNTVDGNRFQLAFQPIVDLKNGIIHHYEALVRIEGETSFENPFSFISFGEQAGIIGEFDLAMCQRAIEVLLDAREQGHRPKVAVNLSGKSLSSDLYLDALREITSRNAGINKQLIFEITESAKITDFEMANIFLQELREQGFLCCLDDFGVGESSFNYLRRLQVDFVKIDGSYVRESLTTPRGKHLLKAMANMCKELGIVTIGEMVEDEKVAALLWESGVRFGQGYLFGKPTIDASTLVHCQEVNPYYHGIMRAKRFD
ncbi:MAG: EAL domain-containing protein [Alphaproteobacteria bacterium]|nr:EAL domain-containing protein [Alphaproteobacteria bacterium]